MIKSYIYYFYLIFILFFTADNRGCFKIKSFADKYNLSLIAANFYQAEYDSYCDELYKQLGAA